jgi:hypothetical protein
VEQPILRFEATYLLAVSKAGSRSKYVRFSIY